MSGGQYGGMGGYSGARCGENFNKAWGGGNWMDRVGLGSLRNSGDEDQGSLDETDVPDDAGDQSTVDDDKMNDLTDPNEKARLAQMRARRRRALKARFNKADTIRTSGTGARNY